MNIQQLSHRINERYNADHDMGPNAPIPWYVMDLLNIIVCQQDQIDSLLLALLQADKKEETK